MIKLPSQHQIGDKVLFAMSEDKVFYAVILAVHFYSAKVKYDVEILIAEGGNTRIYNVDSLLVTKRS